MRLIITPWGERLKRWHGEDWHTTRGRVIRDIVYAIDTGLVTTVSFLSGIALSTFSKNKIILASIIQIISGTLAIFFCAYISTKAQKNFFENQIRREEREIEENPQKETEEIREIFKEMSFSDEEREVAVKRITSQKELWLNFMVEHEIGINPQMIDNPFFIGIISACSFLVGALPAILPFFILTTVKDALISSAFSVLFFLFVLGIIKSRITKVFWLWSAGETLVIGAISCLSAFYLGKLIALYFH